MKKIMKKKILISILMVIIGFIIGIAIGYIKETKHNKIEKIENGSEITYFSDETKTEKFTVQLPKEYSDKIFISIDNTMEDVQTYTFKHFDSKEVLFMIYICKDNSTKNVNTKYEVLKETDNYTYLWSQSVTKNEHIKDKETRDEFEKIASYYNAIKNSVVISK